MSGDMGPWCKHGESGYCVACTVESDNADADRRDRERTAATILAALLPASIKTLESRTFASALDRVSDAAEVQKTLIKTSVVLADALRTALQETE